MTTDRDSSTLGARLAHTVVIYLVAMLATLPLFIMLYPFVPELMLPIGTGFRLDHILTFVVILGALLVLVQRFQTAVYGALIMAMLAITVTTLLGSYSFSNAFEGYADMLAKLRESSQQLPMAANKTRPFKDAEKLRELIIGTDPVVRKAAVQMATKNFTDVSVASDEFTLVQSFSIFKEVNNNWKYVSDVKGAEYFAPPAESIELMAGDCDDHAVLMAALIKSIGGKVRLVRTEGHVYPEFRIGDDEQLERAGMLIRKMLFVREVGDAPLYHHTDADGVHWMNMDYTRNYPGGELMNESIIGILEV